MKIAYIAQFYEPVIGGVEKVIKILAERMAEQGHEVHVFTSDFDKSKRISKKEEIINKVHVHRYHYLFSVTQFSPIWPSLLWKAKLKDFDVIHIHVFGHLFTLIGGYLAKINKKPVVITTHCPWTGSFGRNKIAMVALYFSYLLNRLSFKWADKIIAITPWEIDNIIKYGGRKDKITIIPNGVDDILFKKIKNNRFKKIHGINGKLVLFFGRFNITKGADKLALAAKELIRKRKDIWFVFVGPDEGIKERVKEIVKDEERIIVLPPIRDIKKIAEMYQAADVYMLPSYREGLPLTLFEAMASGMPIIASPVQGIPYEMTTKNGIFVNYGDINGLQNAILKILDNPKLARKMSVANRKKALNYKWENIADKTEKIYKSLIK